MSETLGLKNVNLLSKEQYDGVAEPTNEELWAVEVETYSDNDGNWYRIYPDGWVEQGGLYNYGSLAKDWNTVTITFLKAFSDTSYTLTTQASRNDSVTSGIGNQSFIINFTNTSFKAEIYGDGNSQYFWWQACGQGA